MYKKASSLFHSTPSLSWRVRGGSAILRQALALLREERLFSGIYIVGTALAIAITMVMAVVYYIKLAPIYPEPNRARTVYFNTIQLVTTDENGRPTGMTGFSFSEKAFEEWFRGSKNVEYCAPTLLAGGSGRIQESSIEYAVKGKDDYMEVVTNYTNADFFRIYEYDFIEGRPLSDKEVENHEMVCVISDDFAEHYFGKGNSVLGRMVEMESVGLTRIVGVVRATSRLTPDTYAQVFKPYTLRKTAWNGKPYAGMYDIVATVKNDEQLQALKREIDNIAARLTLSGEMNASWLSDQKQTVCLTSGMETHPMHVLRQSVKADSLLGASNWQVLKHYAALLFILLFVPALNLCGIVAGRMERRSAEMAVRKTFGARRSTLLWQVVTENLVLTTIGGILGLLASWFAVYEMRTWLFGMFFDSSAVASSPIVTGEMLFAPLLFVGAFAAILLLNLLSALLPALLSLRKPIVESMMEKR